MSSLVRQPKIKYTAQVDSILPRPMLVFTHGGYPTKGRLYPPEQVIWGKSGADVWIDSAGANAYPFRKSGRRTDADPSRRTGS